VPTAPAGSGERSKGAGPAHLAEIADPRSMVPARARTRAGPSYFVVRNTGEGPCSFVHRAENFFVCGCVWLLGRNWRLKARPAGPICSRLMPASDVHGRCTADAGAPTADAGGPDWRPPARLKQSLRRRGGVAPRMWQGGGYRYPLPSFRGAPWRMRAVSAWKSSINGLPSTNRAVRNPRQTRLPPSRYTGPGATTIRPTTHLDPASAYLFLDKCISDARQWPTWDLIDLEQVSRLLRGPFRARCREKKEYDRRHVY